jgi:hypothetical protein
MSSTIVRGAAFVAWFCLPAAAAAQTSPGAPPAPALAAPVEPAPAAPSRNDGLAVGFTLHRFHDDFALGGVVSSPSLLDGMLRLTAGGGVAWYPHAIDEEGFETWRPYGHLRLVIEAGARIPSTPLRLYGFGGGTALVLPNDLSSKKVRFGGIGGFGFEFRFQNVVERRDAPVSYFVELGGIGTGATANRLPGHPIFANGFLITTGLRAYF